MVTWDDFDRIWARTSPLTPYEFSDPNYSQGWNFIGSTPPARQMWDSIQKKNDEKFKFLRDNFGTPHIVTQASDMTDTDMVYVYMGSEAGWNSGHWYYYNEGTSSWADGGVYNSVAFVTDTTLSIAGQPADAKATGDALALKADLAGCTFTGNVSVNADFSVTGDSTLTGNVSASGDVNATGDVTADNISATTNGTIGGALSVAGASTLTGNVSAGADVTVVGDVSSANIIASNNANIGGNATVTGSVASASLTTTADGTIGGNLSVSGTTTLTGDAVASADLSVAGDSALTNLSVSGTTALAGTSTAPTPSADDNSTKIATTEYVQTEIKPIETDVDIAQKDIANIKALLQGHLYNYQTDNSSAYTKSVPSGAMPYAGLEQIGGKTVVWNQLEPNPTTVYTSNGAHAFVSGTKFYAGHKYYMRYSCTGTKGVYTGAAVYLRQDGRNIVIVNAAVNHTFSAISQSLYDTTSIGTEEPEEGNCWVYVYLDGADSVTNIQIVDLTLMFGSGNEPSTTADYEAIFPSINAYNEGTLLSAGVTSVVSKDGNNATLQTYSIPASIQALEGYGWSAGSVYNYIDFERKVFVQNVCAVDLGTLSWTRSTSYTNSFFYTSLSNRKTGRNDNFIIAMYNNDYEHYTSNSFGDNAVNMSIAFGGLSGNNQVFIRNDSYSSASDFKSAMSGVYMYYELATPVEVDISQYLTDDNLIQVESGGTLTFPNSNGTDYQIPVPSEEEYMIDLQEAINNG